MNIEEYMGLLSGPSENGPDVGRPDPNTKAKTPERKAPGFASNVKDAALGQLETLGNAAHVAGRTATLGGTDQLHGAVGAITSLGKHAIGQGDAEGFGDALSSGFNEGKGNARAIDADARDNLGFIGSLAADAAGSISKFTGPGALSKFITRNAHTPNTIKGLGKRLWDQGKVGAAEAVITNIITENDSHVGKSLALGGGAGMVGQALLGELLPRAIKYGFTANAGALTKVANYLLDKGPVGDKGFTPENIRSKYRQLEDENTNIFQLGAGDVTAAMATERLTSALAKATFPTTAPEIRGQVDQYSEKFLEALSALDKMEGETRQNIADRFYDVLGAPKSKAAKWMDTDAKLEPYRDMYAGLSDGNNPDLGGKKVRFMEVSKSLEKRLQEKLRLGAGPDGIENADKTARKLWNELNQELRPAQMRPHARSLEEVPHGESAGNKRPLMNLEKEKISLSQLLSARQSMAEKFTPGTNFKGTTVTKRQAAHGMKVLEALDEEIASKVGAQYGDAKGGFAKYMKISEMDQVGADFYSSMANEKKSGANLAEYIDGLKVEGGISLEKDALRNGYREAMMVDIENNGAHYVMNRLLGDVPHGASKADIVKSSTTGLKNLEKILGKEEAHTLVDQFVDQADLLQNQQAQRKYLELKGYDPAAIDDIIREGDERLLYGAITPGQQSLAAISSIGAVQRHFKALGVKESEVITELLTARGPAAVKATENMLSAAQKMSSTPVGSLASVQGLAQGDKDDAPNAKMKEQEEGMMEDIFQYLQTTK